MNIYIYIVVDLTYGSFSVVKLQTSRQPLLGQEAQLGDDELVEL